MTHTTARSRRLASPWAYLIATFIWTWTFWGLAIALQVNMESALGLILLLIGVSGPAVTGIIFTRLTRDAEGRRDYWRRVIDFRRAGRWWWAVLLFVPVLNGLAALLDTLLGAGGTVWGEAAQNVLTNPGSIVFSLMFATLIPFIEELGWRGYVLDRLQDGHTALASSLILGSLWSLWHLPMFFIPGSYQAGLGILTPAFWLFMVGIVPLSLPFTWIYNNSRRSTLAVIVFHAMVNFWGEVIALSPGADTWSIALWFVAAAAITLIWGGKTLTRSKRQ